MRLRLLFAACSVALLGVACTGSDTVNTPAGGPIQISWATQTLEPGPYDQPRFSLALTLSGTVNETIPLGDFAGSFSTGVTLTGPFQDPILAGVSWWAGAGDEFAVQLSTPTTLDVVHREIDEESAGGQPRILETIGIPEGSTVTAK